jgi:hypothetical protein
MDMHQACPIRSAGAGAAASDLLGQQVGEHGEDAAVVVLARRDPELVVVAIGVGE